MWWRAPNGAFGSTAFARKEQRDVQRTSFAFELVPHGGPKSSGTEKQDDHYGGSDRVFIAGRARQAKPKPREFPRRSLRRCADWRMRDETSSLP